MAFRLYETQRPVFPPLYETLPILGVSSLGAERREVDPGDPSREMSEVAAAVAEFSHCVCKWIAVPGKSAKDLSETAVVVGESAQDLFEQEETLRESSRTRARQSGSTAMTHKARGVAVEDVCESAGDGCSTGRGPGKSAEDLFETASVLRASAQALFKTANVLARCHRPYARPLRSREALPRPSTRQKRSWASRPFRSANEQRSWANRRRTFDALS